MYVVGYLNAKNASLYNPKLAQTAKEIIEYINHYTSMGNVNNELNEMEVQSYLDSEDLYKTPFKFVVVGSEFSFIFGLKDVVDNVVSGYIYDFTTLRE